MYCSQCAHNLDASDVYCPKCAKPVASFNFDAGQIPHVEYIGENETPTVVRSKPVRSKSPSAFLAGGVVGGLAAVTAAIAILGVVYLVFKGDASPNVSSSNLNRATPETHRSQAIPAPASTTTAPPPTPFVYPTITKTPIDIDAERAKIEERENRERVANTNAAVVNAMRAANRALANAQRSIANASNFNAANTWPPSFDSQGRRLRAICNDGTLSYWQGDRAFVCMVKGGPRVLYW